jgi:hypothetical protein
MSADLRRCTAPAMSSGSMPIIDAYPPIPPARRQAYDLAQEPRQHPHQHPISYRPRQPDRPRLLASPNSRAAASL